MNEQVTFVVSNDPPTTLPREPSNQAIFDIWLRRCVDFRHRTVWPHGVLLGGLRTLPTLGGGFEWMAAVSPASRPGVTSLLHHLVLVSLEGVSEGVGRHEVREVNAAELEPWSR